MAIIGTCRHCACPLTDEADQVQCAATPTLICVEGAHEDGGCGKVLSPEERHWLGTSCEVCSTLWAQRLRQWNSGSEDPALDRLFGNPKLSQHGLH